MQVYSKIAIIGVGLIGGSLGLSLTRKKISKSIVGVDEFSIIHQALERGAITEGFISSEVEKAVKGAEIIFLCTPVKQIIELLPIVAEAADENALICDVGSTKSYIVSEAEKFFPKNKFFLGTHPMAGAENRGIESADPFLFENAIWVLTPGQRIPETLIRKIGILLEKVGAKILMLTPMIHDKIAGGVSHLPQFAALALVNLLSKYNKEDPNYLKLAAGGFRDMTRIASSPYSIWKDICKLNKEQIDKFLENFIIELQYLKGLLQKMELESYFDEAAKTRLSIPHDSKGFMRSLYDLSIAVEDKPGIIFTFSKILAENNINIKDIEVLKVREGEGGTIRLAFDTEKERQKAVKLIRSVGLSCYARE